MELLGTQRSQLLYLYPVQISHILVAASSARIKQKLGWLPTEKHSEGKNPSDQQKVRNGLAPSYQVKFTKDFVTVRAPMSSDTAALAVLFLN